MRRKMGRRQDPVLETPAAMRPPATTLKGREDQLIALAVDRAEQQIRDGTASAQVITHYSITSSENAPPL